jgi:hypothetical protein
MGPWALCFFCFFLSIQFLGKDLIQLGGTIGFGRERKKLQGVVNLLREIEETLAAGLVPTPERWQALQILPAPWSTLATESLQELRSSGGALLPTLKRLRNLAEDHQASLSDARAKTSQAFAQAGACSLLVPILGTALYVMLPGIEQSLRSWLFACALSLILTGMGSVWLLQLSENARWGGLAPENRSWVLSSQCAGERFLALVRCGTPPDLAWTKAGKLLTQTSLTLAVAWGPSVWETPKTHFRGLTEQAIIGAGSSIRKAVQVSLMEGRACTERVETALAALRLETKSLIDRELMLLATRALKPLFTCVAPALFGLLVFGLWLAVTSAEVGGDSFGAF